MTNTKANLFQVTHPDLGTVQISAVDKYAATIAAAKEWNVPWTQIAKDCVAQDLGRQQKTLCKRCGRVWVPQPGYCPQCAALVRSRDRDIDRLAKAAAAQRRRERG